MFAKSTKKFFSKLQNQILLLLFLSSVIPLSVVGWYSISSSSNALSDLAKNELEEEVADEAANILSFLNAINDDVLFLSKVPPIQGIIRAKAGGGVDKQGNSSYDNWVKRLQTVFAVMMQAKPYYMELRYLDDKGNEMVRVDSDGTKITVIPKAQLQNKAKRSFFTETIKLSPGSIYVSPVELHRENGVIKQPYKPVIRYATPIFDSAGLQRGIVIANVFAEEFIKFIADTELAVKGEEALLVNKDGYYLSHPNPKKEWGFELNTDQNLRKDYPKHIAQQILRGEQGLIDQGTNKLISYYKVVPNGEQRQPLFVINHVSKGEVFASVNSFKILASLIILVAIAAVLPLAMVRLRQLVNLIKQLVNGISTSSQEMFSTLEEQERIAGQQAASVNETTITMDELEASCRQSAEQADAAAIAAQQALQLTQNGTQAVGETLEGMSTLEEKVDAIAKQSMRLSRQTNRIGDISELVSELANQTNMLALNASVEAVRAGEHGKGFAVVATEIRKLADQSKQSAQKINFLVSQIQNEINSTVMVTDEGTKTVKTGVQIAQKTAQAFTGVADAVNNVVLNNQQISLNLKQQVDGIQQVLQAMSTVNKGAKETVIGITQSRVGTEQLKQAAVELKRMV
ncbi:MAG: methyl-accepting chemotaxis protein [Moorea sp. SIO3C2]|nr:methyl-accepting chemotaxis protein [Moorena sp. SIO3C2]